MRERSASGSVEHELHGKQCTRAALFGVTDLQICRIADLQICKAFPTLLLLMRDTSSLFVDSDDAVNTVSNLEEP